VQKTTPETTVSPQAYSAASLYSLPHAFPSSSLEQLGTFQTLPAVHSDAVYAPEYRKRNFRRNPKPCAGCAARKIRCVRIQVANSNQTSLCKACAKRGSIECAPHFPWKLARERMNQSVANSAFRMGGPRTKEMRFGDGPVVFVDEKCQRSATSPSALYTTLQGASNFNAPSSLHSTTPSHDSSAAYLPSDNSKFSMPVNWNFAPSELNWETQSILSGGSELFPQSGGKLYDSAASFSSLQVWSNSLFGDCYTPVVF